MLRLLLFVCILLCFTQIKTGASETITITPESGHIRVNRSTIIMCNIGNLYVSDCKFKIENRDAMLFDKGSNTTPIVVTENGVKLYTAFYVGRGPRYGECGLGLLNVAEGFYVIGCQLEDWKGKIHREFTTLLVDNSRPLKMKVNVRYQRVETGSDVDILCSSKRRQKLGHCGIRLPTNRWLNFQKGHQSLETDQYHYTGRGLDKGDCGVKLLNVTGADSGVVWCHTEVGTARGLRGVIIKVGNLLPTTRILTKDDFNYVNRGETLQVVCVMEGAHPLPQMVWRYDSEEVKCQDVGDKAWKENSFTWLWEDQFMRQSLALKVGNKIGYKDLQCVALESSYLCKNRYSPTSLPVIVRPACGIRKTTHYGTAYKSNISKRDTLQGMSKSDKIVEARVAKSTAFSDILPKVLDTDAVPVDALQVDGDDVSDTQWDEVTSESLENATKAERREYSESSAGYPAYGSSPVVELKNGTVLTGSDPNVEFDSYPWMAGVYKNIMGKYEQQCGGTLVTETHVISAAHCFWSHQRLASSPPEDYMIALGKIFRDWDRVDDMVQKRTVDKLDLHPSWRGLKRNFQYDIAVVQLSESVVYTPRVAPACLDWDDDSQIFEGDNGVVTGWGFTEDGHPSETLRYIDLLYVDSDTCFDKLPVDLQGLLSTDKFCAGYTNQNISVCPGDSGGGILFKETMHKAHFLRGVVSLSFKPADFKGKCYAAEVTGFTMVSQSLKWLKKILNYD